MTDHTHLAIRRTDTGGVDAILTLPDGHEVDLGQLALADGLAITGLDTANQADQEITLSCKLVLSDLDVDLDVLRAQLVDADGNDIPLDQLEVVATGGAK